MTITSDQLQEAGDWIVDEEVELWNYTELYAIVIIEQDLIP